MHIKGVLFDLDGTLLDTEPIYDEADQKLIDEYGNKQKLDWSVKRKIIGTTHKDSSRIFVESFQINLTPEEFQKKKDELLVESFKKCKFKKGAKEITHKLKYELGLKIAIATASSKNNFENKTYYKKDWVNDDIDVVITSERIKEGKPSPDIFILSAKELGLQPDECIVFEDGVSGVKAAIRAGVRIVIAVMEEYQRNKLEDLIYDKNKTKLIILDSLEDFDFSLLNKNNNQ